MEFVGTKRGRKRKRKRRCMNHKQRRDQIKFEVRLGKRQKIATDRNIYTKKEKSMDNSMEANAFWENYKAAHEWQKRHNTTWWKTRCFALEHENHVLKETIRNLIQNQDYNHTLSKSQRAEQHNVENTEVDDEDECNIDDNLEFHLNEDMMDFLAQSIRHKIELKNRKESEEAAENNGNSSEETIESGLAWVHKRNEDAKLLYGEASSRVLAMETALQTTIERHIDKAKPQYWPNIPLKL